MKRWSASLLGVLLPALLLTLLLPPGSCRRPPPAEDPPAPAIPVVWRAARGPEDILPLAGRLVPPVVYTGAVSLAGLPSAERKRRFVDLVLPAVLISKERFRRTREQVLALLGKSRLDSTEVRLLDSLKAVYRVEDARELPPRLRTHPTSIVLAQAALESGWGTSRFFAQANNVFGIWSFDPGEPRLPAGETREGERVYLKRYRSLIGAVHDYFLTLGRGGPYADFRFARRQGQRPLQLLAHLDSYSELGDEYVRRLRSMIVHNDLLRWDDARLDLDGLAPLVGPPEPEWFARQAEPAAADSLPMAAR